MEIDLGKLWDGGGAPAGTGGRAQLDLHEQALVLRWDLALAAAACVPDSPPGWRDGLWEHDVVEVFLAPPESASGRYVELEAGAAGHWLALAFGGVRQRAAEWRGIDVSVSSRVADGRWQGRLEVPREPLEAWVGPPPWHGLVTAVTGPPGSRTHLTWPRLPGAQPDFHQPEAWRALAT